MKEKVPMDLPPERELHYPAAPWRPESYEHFNGTDFPDLKEEPVVVSQLRAKFPTEVLAFKGYRGDASVLLRRDKLAEVVQFLRDDSQCQMDLLRDLFGVDNLQTDLRLLEFREAGLEEKSRFEVIYHLYSLRFRHDLRLRVGIPENPCEIDSIHHLYKCANWHEREAWEMYGVIFKGHPNLRRLLTHENFEGYPLRKDYPVRRRHNFTKPVDL